MPPIDLLDPPRPSLGPAAPQVSGATVAAAKQIGGGVRVVSMPCMERFDRQSDAYKAEVLPDSCRKRVAMEAGVSTMWYKYVGLDGKVIGVDRFGFSAPGDIVMAELGMTADNCAKEVKAYM